MACGLASSVASLVASASRNSGSLSMACWIDLDQVGCRLAPAEQAGEISSSRQTAGFFTMR